MFRSCLAVACALAFVVPDAQAQGNLSIDKLWVEFGGRGGGRSDVVIRNDSKDRYYITVTTAEIVNPGTDKEERVVRADPEQAGLLVTPNRLILEPGVMRAVRIVSLNEGLTQDRIYRVLITPEVARTAVDEAAEGERGLRIKMVAAYDVLVVARPADAKPDLQVARAPDKITLRNAGTTNLLLSEMRICPAAASDGEAEGCRESPSVRLYANQTVTVDLTAPDERLFVKTRAGPTTPMLSQSY